jgi:glycosyltransferase involved in cell wall biosynthesis
LVFSGRIVPSKGLEWLLRALARADGDAVLDVAGDGYLRTGMEQLALELGLEERVHFYGWLRSEQVAKLVRNAQAVVFPSVWHEPAGLVTLEAAARGRPVIAGRVGGIPEYATEDFAVLVDPNDVEALSKAITDLIRDREKQAFLGQAGLSVARDRFALDQFMDRLGHHYDQVIASQSKYLP